MEKTTLSTSVERKVDKLGHEKHPILTNEQREIYSLHAQVDARYKRRLAEAQEIITNSLAHTKNPYVGFSRGKDSTVTLHLVRALKPDVNVISVITDADLPDMIEYGETLMRAWSCAIHWARSSHSVFDVLQTAKQQYGDIWAQANNAASVLDKLCFFTPLMSKIRELACDGAFIGLRKEESHGRRANLNARGSLYYHQERELWICCPLMSWNKRDVMAYLVSNNIPIGPVYGKTLLHPAPEDIREGWYIPGAYAHFDGKAAWLKYYYPNLYHRLIEAFPEIACVT